LLAYLIWGSLPLYIRAMQHVGALELLAHRVIWSVPTAILFIAVAANWRDVRAAFSGAHLKWLALSGLLIGVNWTIYIWAVNAERAMEASLGYYINPLVNVLIGAFFLKEHISGRQWIAVALAAIGVGMLFSGALTTLWISLTLAFSFGFYGMVRKLAPVGALPGLTVESLILSLPAAAIVLWHAQTPPGSALAGDATIAALIAMGGIVTAVPLLMFATAARRMDYSTLGFVQFLAPTIMFILGLTVFREPLDTTQLASFIAIWCAIGVFSWDLLARRQRSKAARKA